ncbi:MAG: hypothetical protein A2020_15065 [Lentisphaerae bacterium GWF2_45_14]|nr:MAG: hypothetical protein A2020_15065 [Lentisphaerae bacterium GWF2_45_14]
MSCNNFTFSLDEIKTAARENRLLSLEIEPTLRCNYHCPYCYSATNAVPENELSYDELTDVITQAKHLGARKIVILGGEPLLYERIFELVDFIGEQGLVAEMFSNGAFLTGEKAAWLFRSNVSLVLKLNSFKPEVQSLLTGENSALCKAMNAIQAARDAGYPGEKASLAVSTVICSANVDELEDIWRYLRDNNILPYFEVITPQGKANENSWLQLDPHKIKSVFERISKLDFDEYGHEWEPRPPLVGSRCLRHLHSCLITSTGAVFPCVGINEAVGSIRESYLKDIICDSEIIQDLRNFHDTIKEPCGSCEFSPECFGCRGATYQLTGDWLAADPICWKNQDRLDCISRLPVDVEKFIPHKPPMRMIDTLDIIGEKKAVVSLLVRPDNIFLDENGRLSETVFIELIAQAMAACDGFSKNAACDGMIIGLSNYEISGSAGKGDELKVLISKNIKFGNWGVVSGRVEKNGKLIATGEIKIWQS